MLRAREVSARELLDAHLERIDRLNPAVNAIVTLDTDGVRSAADAADAALAAGEEVGPLHGLPVAHKDTHATGGMRTTWGSPLHADTVPLRDELIVARYAEAGAVRVGKTNVPEFAAGSHTFNTLFGASHNPYRHGLSVGGSSGGAAAALAAGFVPLADGSDMGGSLRNPAGFPPGRPRWAGRSCRCRGRWGAPSPTSRSSCRSWPDPTRGCRSRWPTTTPRDSPRPCPTASTGCGWHGRRTSAGG